MNSESYVELFKFCFSMPKIELHAHLTGSVRVKTILELLDESDKEDYINLMSCINTQSKDKFEKCFGIFGYIYKIITSIDVVRRITFEMLVDWSKNNCYYLEIRSNLKAIQDKTCYDYLICVLEEINKFNENKKDNLCRMQTRFLISINRQGKLEDAYHSLECYKRVCSERSDLAKLIVGVDYGGLEGKESFTFEELVVLINEYKKFGLKCTLHIGEVENYKLIDYNLLIPDRLGHTDYLTEEESQEIIDLDIPYECCPSSSFYRLGLISYKDTNFKKYYKKVNSKTGKEYTKYSINTDDFSLFASDLSTEYFEMACSFGIKELDLINLVLNSCETIFDEKYKSVLIERINNYKDCILKSQNN